MTCQWKIEVDKGKVGKGVEEGKSVYRPKQNRSLLKDLFLYKKNQGKRSRKQHLLKEAIRKIAYKQIMWRV